MINFNSFDVKILFINSYFIKSHARHKTRDNEEPEGHQKIILVI